MSVRLSPVVAAAIAVSAFPAPSCDAASLNPVPTNEFEALVRQTDDALAALAELDPTLASNLQSDAAASTDGEVLPSRKSMALQRVLDRACLLEVAINPESRVKVAPGPVARNLRAGVWRTCLVKVHNIARVMSPLRVFTDQDAGDARDDWLEIELYQGDALPEELTGDVVEYRVIRFRTDQVGYRAAVIAMDVGQGTADIGFRNDILMTFRCEASE